MSRGIFVTGTDTGIGKTFAAVAIMQALRHRGLSVAGMKPVASGCEPGIDGDLINDDALQLQSVASHMYPYEQVNPYAFLEPIAPHIAAQKCNKEVSLDKICVAYETLSSSSQWVIVEGAGGWRVPINQNQTTSDLVRSLHLDVIMVVGLRLGCINHALLTAEAIRNDGIRLSGWVINCLSDDYLDEEETVKTLTGKINSPCLGRIPWQSACPQDFINCESLLEDRV